MVKHSVCDSIFNRMLKITNKKGFFIEISILSKSDKKVLKFKRLFYAKGTKVVMVP